MREQAWPIFLLLPAPDIVEILAVLVLAEEQPTGMRYRMLETLREYARERLESSGERETFRQHL